MDSISFSTSKKELDKLGFVKGKIIYSANILH